MIQIAISLLALAAGVHLLIQVKQAGLSALYRNLAWLVVLLSLAFMACGVARGVMHMRQCQSSGQCSSAKGGEACPYMKGGHGDCKMEAADCCKEKKECCKEGEEKECCREMKMKGGCPEMGGEMKGGCKEMTGGKGACSEMGGAGAKPACCAAHKGMKADSTAKK